MRSRQLEASLTELAEQAAARLHADIMTGREVPFELESRSGRGRGSSPLYCYRPLTSAFIAERFSELRRLPSYPRAAALIESFDGLDRYLVACDGEAGRRGARADRALLALLNDIFEGQTDFELRPERLERALARLDGSALASATEVTLVATLHGLTIASPELALTRGLLLAQPHALQGAPEGAHRSDADDHLLVVFTAEASNVSDALAEGAGVVRELLRALRLYGDGRIALGTLAWTRVGSSPWTTIALGRGGRPHGMLVVRAEQEDEMRAFCNLISRRAPHASEIAWALSRYEMGCERASEYEALSDYLLGLRVLLVDQGSDEDDVLADRLAALCATPERRPALAERTLAAIALERDVIAGRAVERASGLSLVRDLAGHLRALLRDVICGHLPADLISLADEILLGEKPSLSDEELDEEAVGDLCETGEILHLAV